MCKYGYARVSSVDQNLDRQLIALQQYGVNKDDVYFDKISGKDFQRKGYQRLIRKLKENNELYILSIDRLGRNYQQIIEQWNLITKKKKANIIVIDMPLLDTRKENDLTNTLITDIVLQLLSYVAQKEREFIKQRQKEGIMIAQANGVKFGRKKLDIPSTFPEVKTQYINGTITSRDAAKKLDVCHKTFLKWVKENGD